MKKIYNCKKYLVILLGIVIFSLSIQNKLIAQTCNQVEILHHSPDCLNPPKANGAVAPDQGRDCKAIAVCLGQSYNYSAAGVGWVSYNWTATGPASVTINPNATSANISIVWPAVGVYTLTLTVVDGGGNIFTTCMTVTVKNKPIANFTFAPNNVCAGSTISFTNTTTPLATSVYAWNFGDPASGPLNFSTNIHESHIYNSAGTYTVTLVASSFSMVAVQNTQGGFDTVMQTCCSDTITKQVTIKPGQISIECISTVCANDTATYHTVGCANPTWLPPVGGTIINQSGNNVTIIWGNGNVQGQIQALCPGGCTASVTVPIIPQNPVPLGNTMPCPGSITSYTLPALPGTFYTWTLTNTTAGTLHNAALSTYPDNNTVWINWGHPGITAGNYELSITLTNKHICCNSTGKLIIKPKQKFKAYSDQTICKGTAASLSVSPATGTFNWLVTPILGVVPSSGTGATFSPVFNNTGVYTVKVWETGGNYCNSLDTQYIKITVVSTPLPGIINGPAAVCPTSTYTYGMSTAAPAGYFYSWSIIPAAAGSFQPGNLTTTTGDNVNILWNTLLGTISVVLQRNTYPPCPSAPVTKPVVQAVVGTINGQQNVCVDDQFMYTLMGGNLPATENVNWVITPSSLGSVVLGAGTNSPTIQWHGLVVGAGPWTATIQGFSNCGNTALFTVNIGRKPIFTLSQSGNICLGGVTLAATNNPSYTYLWSPGGQTTNSIVVTNPGSYTVTVSNGPCSITQSITVKDPFQIRPRTCGVGHCNGLSTNELLTVEVLAPAIGTFTYQWFQGLFPTGVSMGAPVTNTNLTNTYMATDSGWYYVVVNYGTCTKNVPFYVKKVCCPDVNNPQITSVVRNSCKTFTFTGTTANPTGASITWNFGDNITAVGVSGVPIQHTYSGPGIYCVTFCVGSPSINPTNCKGNCTATSVIVPIGASFDYVLGCNGCIAIRNLSEVYPTSNAATTTYSWNFGDGSPVVTTASPVPPAHCYTALVPTNYTVTLTMNYSDPSIPLTCQEIYSASFTYTPLDITIVPTPVCSGNLVTFTSNPSGFVSYAWNFGDTYSSYVASTVHAYATVVSPTNYNVVLTVVDALGTTCTKTKPVTVNPGINSCSILPKYYICPGSAALLSVTPVVGVTYLWQVETSPGVFGPAPGANTSSTYSTTVAGFYRVVLTNSYGCKCYSNKTEVKNATKPKAIIAASTTQLCGSGNVVLSTPFIPNYTYAWYANAIAGLPASTSFVHNVFGQTVTTTYFLIVTNEYGCKDTCQLTVYVNPIPAAPILNNPPNLCEGTAITLSVTNYPNNITWNNGANTTSIVVYTAGTYTATYTNPLTGCSSSASITVNSRPPVGLFPHFCDSIPCHCVRPFAIYAPRPLIGLYNANYNITWYNANTNTQILSGISTYNGLANGVYDNLSNGVQTGSYYVILTNPMTGCKDTSKPYSIVVPPCDTCSCAESHWGEIQLTEGVVQKAAAKNNVKVNNVPVVGNPIILTCKKAQKLDCKKTYTINANYFCKDSSCNSAVTYSLQTGMGSPITGNAPLTFTTPGVSTTYIITLYGWCGGKKCDSCTIDLMINCDTIPKECCRGSYWKNPPTYYFDGGGKPAPIKINCDKQQTILITGDLCNKPLVISSTISCPVNCVGIDSVFVYDGANAVVLSGAAPLSIIGLPNGAYTVVVNGYCGGQLCLTCKFFIKVDCNPQECDCKGSHWGEKVVTINNASQSIVCGKNYDVKCKTAVSINANYICADATCNGAVTYTLVQPSGTTSGNVPLNFTPTQNGIYTVSLFGWCGTTKCDSCVVKFIVRDCPIDTGCCPYVIKATPKDPTYTVGTASTIVSNNFAITIPTTANITEVRANVVSYTIDDDFKGDCLKCVNLPFTWASIATATNINTAPPKITMYGGASVPSFNGTGAGAYQNPREVIWNNGSNLNASPYITNIGMSFILPPTPAIDCCKLKGKICVKFIFRDNDCKECEVIECFNFVIKK
jgi:PKD repeat protein